MGFERDQLSQLHPIREGMSMRLLLDHLREYWLSKKTAAPFRECLFQLTVTAGDRESL
jgi:hypothetical protein